MRSRSTVEKALKQRELERSHEQMGEWLKESEELHRFIVNNSPDLVYMLDRNGCFEFLNDRVESLLGYKKDELVGRHYSELIFEEDLEAARNLFNERRTGDRATRNVELRMRSRVTRNLDIRSARRQQTQETRWSWFGGTQSRSFQEDTHRAPDDASPAGINDPRQRRFREGFARGPSAEAGRPAPSGAFDRA